MSVPFWGGSSARAYYALELDPWRTAYLGGVLVPGLADVKGKPARKIEKKNAPGADGSRLTDQGYDAPLLTMTVKLWTSDQWTAWQALEDTIMPRPGKPPSQPLDFAHPAASKITSVLVQSVSLVDIVNDVGTITVELQQWMNPKKRGVTTPKSSSFNVPTVVQVEPAPTPPSAAPGATGPNG